MRIQYCSDLHLEFGKNNIYIADNPLIVAGDILILAGDIFPLHDEFFTNPFLRFITDNYKKVFWVPGNHEFYHKDMNEFSNSYTIDLNHKISIVNNIELNFENIHFVFSTLWSDISSGNEIIIEQGVSDFHCILKNNKKLKSGDFNSLHKNCLNFIENSIETDKGYPTVVVTHHLPSSFCNSPIHNNSPINEAFCVDLSNLIEKSFANFWIYGHSHFNQKPIYIGNTILLTNQLGYVHCNEHEKFKHDSYFSI